MNELRSSLLADDNLNDVELTLKPADYHEFVSASRHVGACWPLVNTSPTEARQHSN